MGRRKLITKREARGCGSCLILPITVPFTIGLHISKQIQHHAALARYKKAVKEFEEAMKIVEISEVDSLTGVQFEAFVTKLLNLMGYKAINIKDIGDFGTDIVAEIGNDKYSIQIKKYKLRVSQPAVRQAISGMKKYNCNKCMVITNSFFTPSAKKLAKMWNCTLINRRGLAEMLKDFQKREKK